MARGLNIFVNIGAKLLPSLNSSASRVERRFAQMSQRLRVSAAEIKLAYREMADAAKPFGAMAAAGGLAFSLKKSIGSGASYQHEIALLRTAGRTTSEVAQAIGEANKSIRAVPTSNLTQNLAILNETTGAFGNFHHALENLQFNTKFGSMMTNMLGMDPSEIPHALNSAVQALEVRGSAMDPIRYRREMSELYRAMVFTRGRFNTEELKAFSQTGNLPIKLYNERFLSRILPSLITELGGGDIVGTQAAAFRNQIMGRVAIGGKKMTAEWMRLGLVPPQGTGGNLSTTGWTAGSAKGHKLAMQDPFAWVETVLLPAFSKAGIDINNTEAVLTQVGKMFGRETAGRFVATMADPIQRKRLHKDEKMIGQAMPMEAAYGFLLETDPNMAWAKFMARMTDLATTLGDKLLTPDVIKAVGSLADGVNSLVGVFDAHPNFAVGVAALMGLGALGATFTVARVGLRLMLAPLKGLFKLLFTAGPRKIGIIGWILRGLSRLGPLLWRGIAALGPLALRALALLGPWLLRGLGFALRIFMGPIGWALLAAQLIYAFRNEIAAAWHWVTDWFSTTGWPAITSTFSAIYDWGARIVDNIINGISANWGRLTSWFSAKWSELAPEFLGGKVLSQPTKGADPTTRPGLSGMRAGGGFMGAGRNYLVGERGPELVTPGRSGFVHTATATRRMLGGGGGQEGQVTFIINGATDPQAVARAVDARLRQLDARRAILLSD